MHRRLFSLAAVLLPLSGCAGTSGSPPRGDAGSDAFDAVPGNMDATADVAFDATSDALVDGPLDASDATPPDAGCVIDVHGGPLTQTAARLGAFYFDGWSGGLDDYSLSQLIPGTDGANREPLSGWEDNTACEVEQQLAWASAYGLSYFMFDWYYPPNLQPACSGECSYLNGALDNYRGLSNRHGMGFAVNYVDQGGFTVTPAQWPDAVATWTDMFTDPDYVRVNGEPLFMVIDYYAMFQAFGSSHAEVKAAFDALRAAAVQKGLPGVFVVGGFSVANGSGGADSGFYQMIPYEADGYDAWSMYSYGYALPAGTGPQPFSTLTQTAEQIWAGTPAHTTLPIIPVATVGWDMRPENFTEAPAPPAPAMWFDPAPSDVAGLVRGAIDWADGNPALRPEPSPAPPLVFVDAWNELLEGSNLVPTVSRLHTMGDAVGAELAKGSTRTRTVLSLQATPVTSAAPYLASGALTESTGGPLGGQVAVSVTPTDGAGMVSQYTTSGFVPTGAVTSFVAVQANVGGDPYGPGPAQVVLYRADFEQTGDTASRVINGDFASGATGWNLVGPAAYAAGLDGGAAVSIDPDAGVLAFASPNTFPVTGDAGFSASFLGRVAPLSARNGDFIVSFFDDAGTATSSVTLPFFPAVVPAGTVAAAGGSFSVDITAFGTGGLAVTAAYAGDATHWGAFARVQR